MMTKTILSDGRHTRPRFAAPTPTPPKFLIATFEQSRNHSTSSKQTTNPNPNGNKTRISRPPQRIADSPWRFAASAISRPRPLFGLTPFAQPHPRKPSGLSQSVPFTPLAQPHPRNEQSARARSAETSKTPARCRRDKNQPLALTFALEAPLATAFLIVTPRLEIAATARETNEMQNSNRYKMTVLQPPPQIALIQRGANDASSSPLKILIANLELEFELTHRELSPLKIPNRKYFAVFHPDCRREFLPQELRA